MEIKVNDKWYKVINKKIGGYIIEGGIFIDKVTVKEINKMAKAKKYVVKHLNKSGIQTKSLFTKKEILERMNWWMNKYDRIIINVKETKEYKY